MMPAGRPTTYRPEYLTQLDEISRRSPDMSIVQIAVEMDVLRESLYDWAEQNPEFSTVLNKARQRSEAYWEGRGQQGIDADKFNTGPWSLIMANRFKWASNYSNKTEVTGANGSDLLGGLLSAISQSTGNIPSDDK